MRVADETMRAADETRQRARCGLLIRRAFTLTSMIWCAVGMMCSGEDALSRDPQGLAAGMSLFFMSHVIALVSGDAY